MNIHAFDTYKHIKALQETGFKEKQAEVIVKSLLESREYDFSKLATKEDLTLVKNDLELIKKDLFSVEERLNRKTQSLEERLTGKIDSLQERLNGKIESVKFDILKWLIPFLIGIIIAIFLKH